MSPETKTPRDAIKFVVNEHMAGSVTAVRIGNTIHVSPATMDVLKSAESQATLETLLGLVFDCIDLTAYSMPEVPVREVNFE